LRREASARKSKAARGRAYLLISMIVLVWNAGATARRFLAFPSSFPATGAVSAAGIAPVLEIDRSRTAVESARSGPLSVLQQYLLGKRIDINTAATTVIAELPGISDTVAAAVVAERRRRGGFRAPADLLSVPGIKQKRLKKILPFLTEMPNN
jgi:hypothetical protein